MEIVSWKHGQGKGRRPQAQNSASSLEELAKTLDFPPDALSLLTQALTHKSAAHEERTESNERLEFLGDAVLGLVVGEYLFREFPTAPEGRLAKLRALIVSAPTLAERARALGLGAYLQLGRGEAFTGGRTRESNLADAFEAIVGAFFLAGGLAAARNFIHGQLGAEINEAALGRRYQDFKTSLQEELQKKGARPAYEVTREEGPDHGKEFTVAVYANGCLLGQGHGRSKKEAEQLAAGQALERMKVNPLDGDKLRKRRI